MATKLPKRTKEQVTADLNKVYSALTDNGPDVDMWTERFSRLTSKARKAGVIDDRAKLLAWLKQEGMFGRKSDNLRGDSPYY